MARWDPDAGGRLERAALELFARQGFAETTVPQIAAAAGVTTRTFFRHFVDKREVLFAGEDARVALFAELVAAAPPELSAIATVEHALMAAAETEFEPRRDALRRWREIVNAEDALQERGFRKQRLVVNAAVEGLVGRGVDVPVAELAAGMAFVAFQSAVAEWATESVAARPLTSYLDVAFSRMHQLAAEKFATY